MTDQIDIADLRAKLGDAKSWLDEHPHFHSARKTDVKNLAAGVESLLDEIERLRGQVAILRVASAEGSSEDQAGQENAEEYAPGDLDTQDDFMTGWREHARWAALQPVTDEQVLAALNATVKPESAAPDLSYWGEESAAQMRRSLEAARQAGGDQ